MTEHSNETHYAQLFSWTGSYEPQLQDPESYSLTDRCLQTCPFFEGDWVRVELENSRLETLTVYGEVVSSRVEEDIVKYCVLIESTFELECEASSMELELLSPLLPDHYLDRFIND